MDHFTPVDTLDASNYLRAGHRLRLERHHPLYHAGDRL